MPTPRKPEDKIRNLGPVSRQWLTSIGIHTLADLQQAGLRAVYQTLKLNGYPVSMNLAYALQGALLDCDWRDISAEDKQTLKTELANI
jgi:hypothetical protein